VNKNEFGSLPGESHRTPLNRLLSHQRASTTSSYYYQSLFNEADKQAEICPAENLSCLRDLPPGTGRGGETPRSVSDLKIDDARIFKPAFRCHHPLKVNHNKGPMERQPEHATRTNVWVTPAEVPRCKLGCNLFLPSFLPGIDSSWAFDQRGSLIMPSTLHMMTAPRGFNKK
jgi:hypothetical protein